MPVLTGPYRSSRDSSPHIFPTALDRGCNGRALPAGASRRTASPGTYEASFERRCRQAIVSLASTRREELSSRTQSGVEASHACRSAASFAHGQTVSFGQPTAMRQRVVRDPGLLAGPLVAASRPRRVVEHGNKALVLVSGYSRVGKSSS
jgi:hypothetical protein